TGHDKHIGEAIVIRQFISRNATYELDLFCHSRFHRERLEARTIVPVADDEVDGFGMIEKNARQDLDYPVLALLLLGGCEARHGHEHSSAGKRMTVDKIAGLRSGLETDANSVRQNLHPSWVDSDPFEQSSPRIAAHATHQGRCFHRPPAQA